MSSASVGFSLRIQDLGLGIRDYWVHIIGISRQSLSHVQRVIGFSVKGLGFRFRNTGLGTCYRHQQADSFACPARHRRQSSIFPPV